MKPMDSKAPAPRAISGELRQRVLDLRRTHSLRQVADLAGLPLGTIKTICSRSGVFRDNLEHRALFTLPPIKTSTSTTVAVPELPPQQTVTGDKEIDAVLWLHQVIKTGQATLIEKAMKAAARIKTPLKDVEKRYVAYLAKAYPGNFGAMLSSFGFADLENMASRAVEKMARRKEAHARFGADVDDVFADTPAEQFCMRALAGLRVAKGGWSIDVKQVDSVFNSMPTLLPNTLSDCLHEARYWHELCVLRMSMGDTGDGDIKARAREDFAFRRLALIRPKTPAEAIAVFRHMADFDLMDREETNSILLNLMGARGGTETL